MNCDFWADTFMCFGPAFSYLHKEFLIPCLPRTKFNLCQPYTRMQSSAGSHTCPVNARSPNPLRTWLYYIPWTLEWLGKDEPRPAISTPKGRKIIFYLFSLKTCFFDLQCNSSADKEREFFEKAAFENSTLELQEGFPCQNIFTCHRNVEY